jgi:GTP cyclohydrolase IA
MVDRAKAEAAVRTLIEFIGEDPNRPGLQATPRRVVDAWLQSWGIGHREPLPPLTMFDDEIKQREEMIVIRDIAFYSHCEHHITPFFGTVDIGYLTSSKGILGLSKFARIVDHFSRRLQVQERLCNQIADCIYEHVSDRGVGVVIRARHFCMISRGVCQPNAETITSAIRGDFLTIPSVRGEFYSLTHTS